jgi:hypothetical protein
VAEGQGAGAGCPLLSPALSLPTAGAVAAEPLGDLRRKRKLNQKTGTWHLASEIFLGVFPKFLLSMRGEKVMQKSSRRNNSAKRWAVFNNTFM